MQLTAECPPAAKRSTVKNELLSVTYHVDVASLYSHIQPPNLLVWRAKNSSINSVTVRRRKKTMVGTAHVQSQQKWRAKRPLSHLTVTWLGWLLCTRTER